MSPNKLKRTEWCDVDEVKPKLVGVYERKIGHLGDLITFQFWTGKVWMAHCASVSGAADTRMVSLSQRGLWRGITKESYDEATNEKA